MELEVEVTHNDKWSKGENVIKRKQKQISSIAKI
jgi:hypothetical protein